MTATRQLAPGWRATLHVAWAAAVIGVLGLNLVWPLPGQEANWPWVGGLLAFPVAAAAILARRPGNGVGRALGLVGVAAAVIFVLSWYALTHPAGIGSRQLEAIEAGAAVLQFVGIVALLYVFPTGRALPGWHRAVFWLFLVLMGGFALAAALKPGPLQLTERPNPLGIGPDWFDTVWDHGFVIIPVFALLGVGSLVARWRRAGTVERAQLKWFMGGATVLVVMLTTVAVAPEAAEPSVVETLAGAVALLAFWALPAAILVAVLRYRLYDIDRLVSRTVTYAVIVAVLAAVYVAGVLVLGSLFPRQGDLGVAASTLAVAALFVPLRRRVQRAVEQRFNRSRYDAERELERFAARLRDELDLDGLTDDLLDVVTTTLQPTRAGVWMR
ncbi:hypothetical protein [Nitriliruptor alkaliphilus]|uniref:hypothetical protein n=1 Tax=Nitriliruptor alkaliphilus TaxID=427918 RepID=UPI000696715C|nr:hypothetical protein [Nitriliruptor alkaliphilus]